MMMWWGFPSFSGGFGLGMVIGLLVLAFWIWMIVDVATRKFRNQTEKILWIVGVIILYWVGALAYFIIIRTLNPFGLSKK